MTFLRQFIFLQYSFNNTYIAPDSPSFCYNLPVVKKAPATKAEAPTATDAHGDRSRSKSPRDVSQSRPQEQYASHRLPRERREAPSIVTWFDSFSVLLKRDAFIQLIYKHAIATIMPGQPIRLEQIDEDDAS